MRPELLNSRVMLQRPDVGHDGIGQPTDVWLDVAPLWARIRHLSGLETVKADAPTSIVKASIRLRYRLGLTAGMRVVHKTTVYSVLAILPDEAKKEFVDLACQVVT